MKTKWTDWQGKEADGYATMGSNIDGIGVTNCRGNQWGTISLQLFHGNYPSVVCLMPLSMAEQLHAELTGVIDRLHADIAEKMRIARVAKEAESEQVTPAGAST